MGETLSTLQFAKRAKKIKNKAVVNKQLSTSKLIQVIEKLRKELKEAHKTISKLENTISEMKHCPLQDTQKNSITLQTKDDIKANAKTVIDAEISETVIPNCNDKIKEKNKNIKKDKN